MVMVPSPEAWGRDFSPSGPSDMSLTLDVPGVAGAGAGASMPVAVGGRSQLVELGVFFMGSPTTGWPHHHGPSFVVITTFFFHGWDSWNSLGSGWHDLHVSPSLKWWKGSLLHTRGSKLHLGLALSLAVGGISLPLQDQHLPRIEVAWGGIGLGFWE